MSKINWPYCQLNSDLILASGLNILLTNPAKNLESEFSIENGNYLISDESKKWNYTGESGQIAGRLKQHARQLISPFYKNYLKLEKEFKDYPQGLLITDFKVRVLSTRIGRKELDEFVKMHIQANLNNSQIGGNGVFEKEANADIWNEAQTNFRDILEEGEKQLFGLKSIDWLSAKLSSSPGIYWIETKARGLIYIGESSNMSERYDTHSKDTHFSTLRRHIGEEVLGFKLQTIAGIRRYFSEAEDKKITSYLSECTIRSLPVNFGRYELEDYLIRVHNPLLNRQENS